MVEAEHQGTSFGEVMCPTFKARLKKMKDWDDLVWKEMDNLELMNFYAKQ